MVRTKQTGNYQSTTWRSKYYYLPQGLRVFVSKTKNVFNWLSILFALVKRIHTLPGIQSTNYHIHGNLGNLFVCGWHV